MDLDEVVVWVCVPVRIVEVLTRDDIYNVDVFILGHWIVPIEVFICWIKVPCIRISCDDNI